MRFDPLSEGEGLGVRPIKKTPPPGSVFLYLVRLNSNSGTAN